MRKQNKKVSNRKYGRFMPDPDSHCIWGGFDGECEVFLSTSRPESKDGVPVMWITQVFMEDRIVSPEETLHSGTKTTGKELVEKYLRQDKVGGEWVDDTPRARRFAKRYLLQSHEIPKNYKVPKG